MNKLSHAYKILREADEKQNSIQQPYVQSQLNPQTVPPVKNEVNLPAQDGSVPQDNTGISDGKYDALDPIGNAEITFEQGNYQTVKGLPKVVSDKSAQLVQTFVPLIEVALIELLGSTSAYKRHLAQCMPSFDQSGKISIEFTFQYIISNWIGNDIDTEAIQHDANYILQKLQPTKANISKCAIDTGEGQLTIMGTL